MAKPTEEDRIEATRRLLAGLVGDVDATAFAVHGGLEPDLLDEVTYWIDQYWQYALLAAVAIIRQCAEHSGTPLHKFVYDLAAASAIDII
jgi:hypothetical protein